MYWATKDLLAWTETELQSELLLPLRPEVFHSWLLGRSIQVFVCWWCHLAKDNFMKFYSVQINVNLYRKNHKLPSWGLQLYLYFATFQNTFCSTTLICHMQVTEALKVFYLSWLIRPLVWWKLAAVVQEVLSIFYLSKKAIPQYRNTLLHVKRMYWKLT